MATREYTVKSPIVYRPVDEKCKGIGEEKRYEIGDKIKLDDETAKPLLDAKGIEAPAEAKADARK